MTSPVGSPTMVYPSTSSSTSGNAAASSTSSGASTAGIGGLTMSNFLTLMTAQLKNQDPLNPTDSNQLLSQISELSTVEGITQLNTSMTTLSNSMLSSQALTSAALVGHGILAPGNSATYTSGTPLTGAVQVPTGATSVTLSITNSGGALVDQLSVPSTSGLQSFSWNGVTANGQTATSGTYNVSASAVVGGAQQAASTFINSTVTSVSLGAAGASPTLNTSLGPVALSAVQQID